MLSGRNLEHMGPIRVTDDSVHDLLMSDGSVLVGLVPISIRKVSSDLTSWSIPSQITIAFCDIILYYQDGRRLFLQAVS
jgi:hypothetical protein